MSTGVAGKTIPRRSIRKVTLSTFPGFSRSVKQSQRVCFPKIWQEPRIAFVKFCSSHHGGSVDSADTKPKQKDTTGRDKMAAAPSATFDLSNQCQVTVHASRGKAYRTYIYIRGSTDRDEQLGA
ncbi:hypothetical protein COCOBI_09-4670 [Coccomyxa sp. Obi]|nr:hypothetical protein COCOBI_09-4670 [Coccomyxa sp. Obi]